MKTGFVKSVRYFLSGDMVSDATRKALDGLFEKVMEPRYRRKASEEGFTAAFERELLELRGRHATHASIRAYKFAKQLSRQA